MDNFFESELMLSNSFNFILLAALLSLTFHVPIWFGCNLSKVTWKKVDYFWPLLTGMGLLGITAEIRSTVADNWASTEHRRAVVILESIHDYSLNQIKSDICSGKTGVNDVELFHKPCMWFLDVAKQMKTLDFNKLPELTFDHLPSADFGVDIFNPDLAWYRGQFEQYQRQKNLHYQTNEATVKSNWERFFWYISPYLLCIAIAIRATKITGELKLEKQIYKQG